MIEATVFPERGLVRLSGAVPNGPTTVTRTAEGMGTYTLRGGELNVTLGALLLEDSEAPLGIPVHYRSQVTTTERTVQTNYVRTPTFLHGQQGWLPGTGRVMSIFSDGTAHSPQIGFVTSYPSGAAATAPPSYVGSVSTPVNTTAAYTLTPPTGGGTAIATNDWMVLIHSQSSTVASPTISAGWTLFTTETDGSLRTLVWTRKRVGGDVGYTVTPAAGAGSIGTLLWVRGAVDEQRASLSVHGNGQGGRTVTVGPVATIRPNLTVTLAAARTQSAVVQPGSGDVAGSTWRTTGTQTTPPDARSLTVATQTSTIAGDSQQAVITYLSDLVDFTALQISFQSNSMITDRTIARVPLAAIPGSPLPYLVTGRFRFASVGVRSWQDVKTTYATWQAVKTANATWLNVRGAASSTSMFLQMFITINNPTTGADLIAPVLVRSAMDTATGTWLDFSGYFTSTVPIPSGSELRLVHGVSSAEYNTAWYLDEFGITSGEDMAHDTLYWFDGDTPVPANPQNYRWPGEVWQDDSGDASIVWSGTVGNSASVFTAPSGVSSTVDVTLGLPDKYPCEPVLLSDPVASSLAIWVSLLPYADTTYPARRTVHPVLDREDSLTTHGKRGWQDGTLSFGTRTASEREAVIAVFRSGRPLLIRTTYREYPENDWYLSLGDLRESRIIPNQRETVRAWSVPFSRIVRPAGLIQVSSAATWQNVKDLGEWQDVKDERARWIDVLLTLPSTP